MISLHGIWMAELGGEVKDLETDASGKGIPMQLPGTLDENQIGYKDDNAKPWHPDITLGNEEESFRGGVIATRFTRHYTYEGEVRLKREIDSKLWEAMSLEVSGGKRIFLEAERARVLRLLIDGKEVPDFIEPSISTDHVFEVTGLLKEGSELTLLSDNSYPGLPHDAIVYSSAATDETQTNWNGVLGYLRLRSEEQVFLGDIRIYPIKDMLTVKMKLYASNPYQGKICVCSDALQGQAVLDVDTSLAVTELVLEGIRLKENVRRWDLEEGNLYRLSVSMSGGETKEVTFGIRDFGDGGQGRLSLNGRRIFLRSEANCGEFPETGHPPMDVDEWMDILKRYRSYGINCMRFHSHCPPEAAFIAADCLGMLMQPELSHWNPTDAFESDESLWCYKAELTQILRMMANHPSFVMLTFGNELHASEKGHERMRELLQLAKDLDSTRLYAEASNGHYGMAGCEETSDFYTSSNFYEWKLRGTFANMEGYINNCYPDARRNFDHAMEQFRKEYTKPVFSFEVGQFEILPDFDELEMFRGISDPANLRLIQKRVEQRGLSGVWKKYVEATGELSRIGYREEIEAAMRTKELSGISLLGLQDFPGQGTALVGMMNSHLQPKPYEFAKPEHFRSFFKDQLPLVMLPKYTWESWEKLSAGVQIANYGKKEISGVVKYALTSQPTDVKGFSGIKGVQMSGRELSKLEAVQPDGEMVLAKGSLPEVNCPVGMLTDAGRIEIALGDLQLQKPVRLNLTVQIGELSNIYPLWVYPKVQPVCPEGVYETCYLDEKAKEVLACGGKVYLTPPSTKEALPSSIQAQFTTDFWSVGTFAGQEGGMGQLIDESHPVFRNFPTEFHTNWQWWPMASQRAVILPRRYDAIVTEMDSYAFLRPMAQLLECKCGEGKLLFSTFGLQDLQQYPEARALLDAIYRYMDSEEFKPEQEIEVEEIEKLTFNSVGLALENGETSTRIRDKVCLGIGKVHSEEE